MNRDVLEPIAQQPTRSVETHEHWSPAVLERMREIRRSLGLSPDAPPAGSPHFQEGGWRSGDFRPVSFRVPREPKVVADWNPFDPRRG